METNILLKHGSLHLSVPHYVYGTNTLLGINEYDLGISANEFTILCSAGSGNNYKAYLLVNEICYFIASQNWRLNKAVKLNFNAAKETLEVFPEFTFAKAGDKIFREGKRLRGCDAATFRFIENTQFIIDKDKVYSSTEGYGIAFYGNRYRPAFVFTSLHLFCQS